MAWTARTPSAFRFKKLKLSFLLVSEHKGIRDADALISVRFALETQTRGKPTGAHKLRIGSLYGEYTKRLIGNNLKLVLVLHVDTPTHSHTHYNNYFT